MDRPWLSGLKHGVDELECVRGGADLGWAGDVHEVLLCMLIETGHPSGAFQVLIIYGSRTQQRDLGWRQK